VDHYTGVNSGWDGSTRMEGPSGTAFVLVQPRDFLCSRAFTCKANAEPELGGGTDGEPTPSVIAIHREGLREVRSAPEGLAHRVPSHERRVRETDPVITGWALSTTRERVVFYPRVRGTPARLRTAADTPESRQAL
jgi:hypothetical protein